MIYVVEKTVYALDQSYSEIFSKTTIDLIFKSETKTINVSSFSSHSLQRY